MGVSDPANTGHPTNPAQGERRRYPRYEIAVPLELHRAGSDVPFRLQTSDISVAGCYVEMTIPLEVGTRTRIVLWLDEKSVKIGGRVVTHHPQFGNGIEFSEFEGDGKYLLEAFLNRCSGALRRKAARTSS